MLNVGFLQGQLGKLEVEEAELYRRIERLEQQVFQVGEPERSRVRFKLAQHENRLESIWSHIEQCKREMLYSALLQINYYRHTELFRQFLATSNIGAFVICNSPEAPSEYRGYSVRGLLKRLLRMIPRAQGIVLTKRDFTSALRSHSIPAIWRQLGHQLGVGAETDQNDIAALLVKRLHTAHQIFVFEGVSSPAQARQLLSDFWQPLVESVGQTTPMHTSYYLMLFVLDYTGLLYQEKGLTERFSDKWKADMPIRMPLVARFTNSDVREWLKTWDESLNPLLPDKLKNGNLEIRTRGIMDVTNGIPDMVVEHICSSCAYFVEGLDEWLKP